MESLYRLFEDRLGFTVYVPRGMEWRDAGIWRFGFMYPDAGEGVARQFLLADETDSLQPQRTIHWLTLEEAREMDFDLVIATVPDNYAGYRQFAQEKGARFIVEVGNVNQWVPDDALILDSTGQFVNGIQFTPEFDTQAFAYSKPSGMGGVASFVNLFPKLPCYPTYEETMQHFDGRAEVYGHDGPHGFLKSPPRMGSLMSTCDFGWHDKITGDGFGYVIHYWASVGRPLIGHASHYRGQLAEYLWEDGVTCIDLDRHSPTETARLMEEIVSDPARHEEMCRAINQRVRLDFAASAGRVGDALGLLVPA